MGFFDLFKTKTPAPAPVKGDINQGQSFYPSGNEIVGGSKQPGGMSASGISITYDNTELRRKARDAMYDSPLGHGIARRFADLGVESGLRLKLEPNHRLLGITPEEAAEWAQDNSDRFHLWAMSKKSDVAEIDNFYQKQYLYAFMQQRDNDMFVRLHYSNNSALPSPLQLQFIDPDQIDGNAFTETDGFQLDDDGIIRDANGKEFFYKVGFFDKKNNYKVVTIPARSKAGRVFMLHGFRPDYPGQGRGFTMFAHLLQELEKLTDFSTAHLQQAVTQSQIGFYTKPSKDAPASSPLEDFTKAAGPRMTGDITGAPAPMPTQQAGVTMLDEFANRNPGAMWVATLQGGEDIGVINPNAPSDSFGTFFEAFASNLGQSMSIGYEAVMLKFGENYSASRALLVLLWRVLKMFTAGAAADFYNPVVEMWLAEEIAAGRTKAPGWNDPRLKAAWCLARWIGSSIPSIDPKKEAEAAKSRMETGSTTGDDEALQYNGSNGEANRAQLKKEYQNLPVAPFSKNYQKPGGINE